MLKYRKRLKQLSLKESINTNYKGYRSHGSPCSCSICKDKKYRDTLRQSDKKIDELLIVSSN